jgi:hypothetical protein
MGPYIHHHVVTQIAIALLAGPAQSKPKPDPRAINGLSGVYTAIGKAGTLTPSFDPVTGDLNFSFSTEEGGNLALGVATAEGIMQLSIVAIGDKPRVLSSARIELNPDGSERHKEPATDAQLHEVSDKLNAAGGNPETLLITIDGEGNVTYAFITGAGDKVTGAINR